MLSVTCDTHTHTLFSRHAYSTIEEDVRAAHEAGMELLGSTDHFSAMIHDEASLREFQFFINRDVWPRRWMGVTVLRGCEADIIDLDGNLFGSDADVEENLAGAPIDPVTLADRIYPAQDYVIASVHDRSIADGATPAEVTQMYVNALANPYVFELGHIGRMGLEFDVDEVLLAAKSQGKLIEINEHSFGARSAHTRCKKIAERCAELGVSIALGTDAHISCAVGHFEQDLAMLDEIGFPAELIASRSPRAFLEALRDSGVNDLTDLLA